MQIGYMGVSKNRGTPKSSILIGFSIINHPFWGTTIFGNTHIISVNVNHVINLNHTPCVNTSYLVRRFSPKVPC